MLWKNQHLLQNYSKRVFVLALFENQFYLISLLRTTHHKWVCDFDYGQFFQ